MPWIRNKPLRTVMRWQLIATAAMAPMLGLLWGFHGAASALLGGAVGIVASAAFALVISRYHGASVGGALRIALRAEAAKIIIMVVLLWLVLTLYQGVVAVGLIGAFAITVVIFSLALFVTDDTRVVPQIK